MATRKKSAKKSVSAKEVKRRERQSITAAVKVPKPLKLLSADHQAVINPLAQRVNAMRRQTHDAGLQLDQMLSLIYPKWKEGNLMYDPGTGEIRPIGEVAPSATPEEVNAPVEKLN